MVIQTNHKGFRGISVSLSFSRVEAVPLSQKQFQQFVYILLLPLPLANWPRLLLSYAATSKFMLKMVLMIVVHE